MEEVETGGNREGTGSERWFRGTGSYRRWRDGKKSEFRDAINGIK